MPPFAGNRIESRLNHHQPEQQAVAQLLGGHFALFPEHQFVSRLGFLTEKVETVDGKISSETADMHGGADTAMINDLLSALQENDQSLLLSGPDETLQTHLAVFASEKARKSGTVENVLT